MISLPPGTEMFQFPGFASGSLLMTGIAPGRVAPFGHPGINACVPLPPAYRSLPRPSSPPCAQASPTRPRSLDYIIGSCPTPLRQAEHARSTSSDSNVALLIAFSRDDSFPTNHYHYPLSNSVCVAALRGAPPRVLQSSVIEMARRATIRWTFDPRGIYSSLRKGGDPAAGSPTATLLRLRPSHDARLRPLGPFYKGSCADFGRSPLPWRDGRCVQGPGTYSPWRS